MACVVGRFGSGERWRRGEDIVVHTQLVATSTQVRSEGRSWDQQDLVLKVNSEEDGDVKAGQHAAATSPIRRGEHKTDSVGVTLGVRKVGHEKNRVYPQGQRHF